MADELHSPAKSNVEGGVPIPFPFVPRSDGGKVPRSVLGVGEALTFSATNGSIATGGVAQQLVPALAARELLLLTNTSAGDLWLNDLGEADLGVGFTVAAGRTIEFSGDECPRDAVWVFGATTGQSFYVRLGVRP